MEDFDFVNSFVKYVYDLLDCYRILSSIRMSEIYCLFQFRQMMLSLDQQHEQEEHDLDSSINAAGSNTLLDIS